jgi:hypothetical protein
MPPPQGLYGSKAPLIDPLDSTTIYLGIDHNGVYKSRDCGATWAKTNTGTNGSVLDTGAQWSMQIDPIDPTIIYANNGYGSEQGVWRSTNGGVDWQNTTPANSIVATTTTVPYTFVGIIAMDPSDLGPPERRHLVISFHGPCTNGPSTGCLAETTDGGNTWNIIWGVPPGGEAAGVVLLDRVTWLYGVPGSGLWRTADGGGSWKEVFVGDGGYTLYRQAGGTLYLAGEGNGGMLRSMDDGLTWSRVNVDAYSVIGDGITLFASLRYCSTPCYFTSPESDGGAWSALQTPVTGQGAVNMLYDPDHHILYSSNETAGFWRVVTH